MTDEIEEAVEELKKQKIVSEMTAQIYLSDIRKILNQENEHQKEE